MSKQLSSLLVDSDKPIESVKVHTDYIGNGYYEAVVGAGGQEFTAKSKSTAAAINMVAAKVKKKHTALKSIEWNNMVMAVG